MRATNDPVLLVANRSTLVNDRDLARAVAAIQRQVDEDFYPRWCVRSTLHVIGPGQTCPENIARIDLVDRSTDAGALGEHGFKAVPNGFAAVKDAMEDGVAWSSVLSHEVLEQLADPEAVRCMQVGALMIPLEVCDAVEGAPYEIDGVAVENFVYPAYFLRLSPGPYDHMRVLKSYAPALARGGYLYSAKISSWRQTTAEKARASKMRPPHRLSRRGRRTARVR